jgi:hypothetical protein
LYSALAAKLFSCVSQQMRLALAARAAAVSLFDQRPADTLSMANS